MSKYWLLLLLYFALHLVIKEYLNHFRKMQKEEFFGEKSKIYFDIEIPKYTDLDK